MRDCTFVVTHAGYVYYTTDPASAPIVLGHVTDLLNEHSVIGSEFRIWYANFLRQELQHIEKSDGFGGVRPQPI